MDIHFQKSLDLVKRIDTNVQVNGAKTCFKMINRCDLHPVCDPADGSNIAEDERDCLDTYNFPKEATNLCQSVHHNEDSVAANDSLGIVMVKAVPCDGISTCWNESDEILCDNDWLTKWIPGRTIVLIWGGCKKEGIEKHTAFLGS